MWKWVYHGNRYLRRFFMVILSCVSFILNVQGIKQHCQLIINKPQYLAELLLILSVSVNIKRQFWTKYKKLKLSITILSCIYNFLVFTTDILFRINWKGIQCGWQQTKKEKQIFIGFKIYNLSLCIQLRKTNVWEKRQKWKRESQVKSISP